MRRPRVVSGRPRDGRLALRRSSIPVRRAASIRRLRMTSGFIPKFSGPNASSLRTSEVKNWVRGFWKTVATSRPVTSSGETEASMSATTTLPVRIPGWKLGTRPLIRRSNVDFPQPLAPHSRTHSPGWTRRLTSFSPRTAVFSESSALSVLSEFAVLTARAVLASSVVSVALSEP